MRPVKGCKYVLFHLSCFFLISSILTKPVETYDLTSLLKHDFFLDPLCSSYMNLAEVIINPSKCYAHVFAANEVSITYHGFVQIFENYAYSDNITMIVL